MTLYILLNETIVILNFWETECCAFQRVFPKISRICQQPIGEDIAANTVFQRVI